MSIPPRYRAYRADEKLVVLLSKLDSPTVVETAFRDAFAEQPFGKGDISASLLFRDWFPDIESDVFISHSHRDEHAALQLKALLAAAGIRAFVDSSVWRHMSDLQLRLDNAYCMKEAGLYDYAARNATTSHVNMILATALSRAIAACSAFIFLSTPSSLIASVPDTTYSPWIHYELEQVRMILKREEALLLEKAASQRAPKIRYAADVGEFSKVTETHLVQWLNDISGKSAQFRSGRGRLEHLHSVVQRDE